MKINIIYDSKYGNGRKLCGYIKQVLEDKGHSADMYFIKKTKAKDMPEADLYIVNTPTHFGSAPRRVRKYLKKLPVKDARFALITTCLDEESRAIEKIRDELSARGFKEVGDGLKIVVKGMKGPLEDGYKEKIEGFLDDILSEI